MVTERARFEVGEGAAKQTSVYSVVRVENTPQAIAHLSEGVPRYWFVGNSAPQQFLNNELQYGLGLAVEANVLTDIKGTLGIQTQAYATTVLVTIRKGLTKLETAGYAGRLAGRRIGTVVHKRGGTPVAALRPGLEAFVRCAGRGHRERGRRCRSCA